VPEDLEAAIRAAWAFDTGDPVDADDWSAANPARGQCGSTALTIHDLLGGELLIAEVIRSDGSRQGVHYWNLLPDGTDHRIRSWPSLKQIRAAAATHFPTQADQPQDALI